VQYLNSASPESVRREIQQLSSRLAKDTPRVREVNEKRVEILAKRLEKFGKIQENRQVIDAQLKAIEDTLELIREQSMTMEHPQELSERLDVVIRDVESTEDAVREMETIFQISPEMESFDAGGSAGHRQRIGN
jgi:chromosome segregation ATPase